LVLTCMLLALPIIYVLSVGPAYRLTFYGRVPTDSLFMIYKPMFYMANQFRSIDHALDWYIGIWLPNGLPPLNPTQLPTPPDPSPSRFER
jgi:hypothetical protein